MWIRMRTKNNTIKCTDCIYNDKIDDENISSRLKHAKIIFCIQKKLKVQG